MGGRGGRGGRGEAGWTQKFCLFCKNFCQQEAISSANDVFIFQITQLSPNFKDAFKNIWRPTIFCQATKLILCSLTAILRRVILFREHDQEKFLLADTKNFACLRCEQGCKNQTLVITNFPIFGKRQTLFFVVVRTGLSEGDDRRIFWGSEFSIRGLFWEGKFGKYFLGRPDLSMDFWGIQNTYFTNVS